MTRRSGTGSSLMSFPPAGSPPGRNKVARLCSQQRIWSAFAKKRGLSRKAGPPVHDDLVARDFTAARPDRTWLTGITEHPTAEGKLYLCAFKDVYSNRIVGYSMGSRMTAGLAVSALRNAVALREPAGTVVVHSDRGSQFRSAAFVQTLTDHGLTGSMGRVGACGDKRRDGIVLRAAAEERPGPSALVNAGAVCAWRSLPGSSGPTTAAGGSEDSAALHPSNTRQLIRPHTPPDPPTPRGQLKPGQSRAHTAAITHILRSVRRPSLPPA